MLAADAVRVGGRSVRYVWKPLMASALLLALVIAGLYAGYKVAEPQDDHTDAVSSTNLADRRFLIPPSALELHAASPQQP